LVVSPLSVVAPFCSGGSPDPAAKPPDPAIRREQETTSRGCWPPPLYGGTTWALFPTKGPSCPDSMDKRARGELWNGTTSFLTSTIQGVARCLYCISKRWKTGGELMEIVPKTKPLAQMLRERLSLRPPRVYKEKAPPWVSLRGAFFATLYWPSRTVRSNLPAEQRWGLLRQKRSQ